MREREVQDENKIQWKCVQALEGVHTVSKPDIGQRLQNKDGQVPVICTPSGGAQTIRLFLNKDWDESMSDESLLKAIQDAS